MSKLCEVRRAEGMTTPVLMYGPEFEAKVRAHVLATGTPVGPAPFLPHTQMVPLRLAKYASARQRATEAMGLGMSNDACNAVDTDLAVCLDLCFWSGGDGRGEEGETLEYDELKRRSKACSLCWRARS